MRCLTPISSLLLLAEVQQQRAVGYDALARTEAACHPQAALPVRCGQDVATLEAPLPRGHKQKALVTLREQSFGGNGYAGRAPA